MRSLFTLPLFPEDEDKTRSVAILNRIGHSIAAAILLAFLWRFISTGGTTFNIVDQILLVSILPIELILFVSRRGYVKIASLLLVGTIWIGLSYLAWSSEGIRDVTFFGYFLPILMAGLLLGWQGLLGFTFASILSGWAMAYAETNQLLVFILDQPFNFALYMTIILSLTGLLTNQMISNLQNALNKARATTQELSTSNKELSRLRDDLEKRVEERTSELERRASQLEAVSSVARAIASVQDIDTLLPAITKLISKQFGYYHVGIFLLD
ncbi:MAG: methyl-accepting chemotaxis protein, partial [Anaerolineales bacterium]